MTGLPLAASDPVIFWGVLAFLAITVLIGVFAGRLVQGSSRRYIVAGKSLSVVFVGTMLCSQAIDGNASLGNAGFVYSGGFWAGASLPLGLVICLFLTAFIFGRRLNRMSLLTLPDFYYRRYGTSVEGFSGLLMILSFMVLVAGNFAASGYILEKVLGIPLVWGSLMAAVIVLTYTIFGGLFSCALTDIFHIYISLFGFWAAFVYFAGGFSGHSWHEFMLNTPPHYLDMTGLTTKSNGALINWATLLSLGLGDLVALDFMERVFAARDGRTAARGAFWGGTVTLIIVIPTSFMGIFALTMLPNIKDHFLIYPEMATTAVPVWIGLFMCSGVLGAATSCANGGILAISSVIGRNLIQRDLLSGWLKKGHMGNRRLLLVVRGVMTPVMVGAFILCWQSPQPGKYLTLAFDIVLAGALVPLVGGMFWKKANTPAALACMFVGSITRLIGFLYMNSYFFHPSANALSYAGIETMIPPVLGIVTFVSVALLTQKEHPGELLFGIVNYIPPEEDVVIGEDLKGYQRPTLTPTPA
jgi:solute:Na+ symporter, SSS family